MFSDGAISHAELARTVRSPVVASNESQLVVSWAEAESLHLRWFDSDLRFQHEVEFDRPDALRPAAAELVDDGAFVVLQSGVSDARFVRLDGDGQVLWEAAWPFSDRERRGWVAAVSDTGRLGGLADARRRRSWRRGGVRQPRAG